MKLKTILVDDEPHALEVLVKYLENFSEIDVVARCRNAMEAMQVLRQQHIDLMFLDIKMPGLTGTELMRSLENPPKVIFTTAYQDYAVEGFDLNAVDYLLKPVPFERFSRAMSKVFHAFALENPQTMAAERQTPEQKDIFLYLKVERRTVKVNVSEIYWIESLRDYIKVVTKNKVLVSKQKISILEALLPEDDFIRIHRSFIVSIPKIDAYHAHAVDIAGKELPIGRNYKTECHRKFKMAY